MAYSTPSKNIPIPEIKPGNQFVLGKIYVSPDKECSEFYLFDNSNNVSVTFGDDIVVSDVNNEQNPMLPYRTARVVAMFNEFSDEIIRTLHNSSFEDLMEEMNVCWQGNRVLTNITNPSEPMGSNSGGMTVSGQDENGDTIDSSPSTSKDGNKQDGNNQDGSKKGGYNIEFDYTDSSSNEGNSSNKGGGFKDDKKATQTANKKANELEDIFKGTIFTIKKTKRN